MLDISFWVAMRHTSPLKKGRKSGDCLYRTDVIYELYVGVLYAIFLTF